MEDSVAGAVYESEAEVKEKEAGRARRDELRRRRLMIGREKSEGRWEGQRRAMRKEDGRWELERERRRMEEQDESLERLKMMKIVEEEEEWSVEKWRREEWGREQARRMTERLWKEQAR